MAELKALTSFDAIASEVARLEAHGLPMGFDIETTGLDPRTEKLVSVTFKPAGKLPLIIDARHLDPLEVGKVVQPLLDNKDFTNRGHNLNFDLTWMLTHCGIPVDKLQSQFYDTMLAELLIAGDGLREASKRGVRFDLGTVAATYGIKVSKQERNWFVGLDKPRRIYPGGIVSYENEDGETVWWNKDGSALSEEEAAKMPKEGYLRETTELWDQPLPPVQLAYIRQDVSVVHKIAEGQAAAIKKYGLEEVVDLENGIIPAVAGLHHFGIAVDVALWKETLETINAEVDRLSTTLHEEFDVAILEDRRNKWLAKAEPYQEWAAKRDAALAEAEAEWPKDNKGKNATGWGKRKEEVKAEFYKKHGQLKPPPALKDGVNLGSTQQIQVALRARGIDIDSTDEESLSNYGFIPVIKTLLEFKSYNTIASRYNDEWLEKYVPNGRLYAGYGQLMAASGRFSSYKPNFQQIPSDGPGKNMRKAIIAAPGYMLVVADFSNVELRIAAELSKDQFLIDSFASGEDLHARTAIIMFNLDKNQEFLAAMAAGVTPKKWTDEHDAVVGGTVLKGTSYRKIAKTINYMVFYGGGMMKLSAMLRIHKDQAKELMKLHYNTFKTAMDWLKSQGNRMTGPEARATGRVYSRTLSGRRRWFDIPVLSVPRNATADEAYELQGKWKGQLASIRRKLGNTPIQGLSADITKYALRLWQRFFNSDRMRCVAVVHDEFIIEVEEEYAEQAAKYLEECMKKALHYYLHVVDVGPVEAVITPYWKH